MALPSQPEKFKKRRMKSFGPTGESITWQDWIKRVNAGLVEVGEAKASELELGKNICALSQAYEEEAE